MKLKPEHHLFVAYYVAGISDEDGGNTNRLRRACMHAGFATSYGHTLLKDPDMQDAIEARLDRVTMPLAIEARDVLQNWIDIATADPTLIARVERTCCRWCWGINHAYQWSPAEFEAERALAEKLMRPPPQDIGGQDWTENQDPNPDCPQCSGEGTVRLFHADMRNLATREKRLIAGIQQTKDGIKVLYRDQDAALMCIAKALNMKVGDNLTVTGPNGGPVQHAHVHANLADLTPQEASKVYQGLLMQTLPAE